MLYTEWIQREKEFYRMTAIVAAVLSALLFMGATAISKADTVKKSSDLIVVVEVAVKANKGVITPDLPDSIYDLSLESNITYDTSDAKKAKVCWVYFRIPEKYEKDFKDALKSITAAKIKTLQTYPTPTVTRTP